MGGVQRADTASELLRRALRARSPRERKVFARLGLAHEDVDPDTQLLLLRQLYTVLMEEGDTGGAIAVAAQMTHVGPLKDLAYHDLSRAYVVTGAHTDAVLAQRQASRFAPPARRTFHAWALATLQQQSGDAGGALRSLARAERWAKAERPLMRAHAAWVRLDAGEAVPNLSAIIATLLRAKCREGYGQFVLGMIFDVIGDKRRAALHLRAFLRRNAAAPTMKTLTLRYELDRARRALAAIESS